MNTICASNLFIVCFVVKLLNYGGKKIKFCTLAIGKLFQDHMIAREIQRLRYRRQYIIAPKLITCPFDCHTVKLNSDYTLYIHNDLVFSEWTNENARITLIGDIFDFEFPTKGNNDILNDIADEDFKNILIKLAKYSGRYVLIFQHGANIQLVHDNTASRKIYYAIIDGQSWIASQPKLLASVLNLQETTEPSKLLFYNSREYFKLNNSNIGDTTIFDEIFQVLPNHYFDLMQHQAIRYWPENKIETLLMHETAQYCAKIIKGYMESICARYDVMLPVTAGKDSRLLLAATKDISSKIFYYVNMGANLKMTDLDIDIPKSLLRKLGLEFHILDPYIPMDEDFKSVYFLNNNKATERYLPIIFNYYSNFSDKINLPGNIASQAYFRVKYPGAKISPEQLADFNHVRRYDFAVKYYERWIDSAMDLCEKTNLHILNLFYWEERMANWGTQIQMEKDIAQEEFNPYNSRLLSNLFLSVDYEYLLPPNYKFHKEIIKNLWPETLQEPINPSFRNRMKFVLSTVGMLKAFNFVKKKIV